MLCAEFDYLLVIFVGDFILIHRVVFMFVCDIISLWSACSCVICWFNKKISKLLTKVFKEVMLEIHVVPLLSSRHQCVPHLLLFLCWAPDTSVFLSSCCCSKWTCRVQLDVTTAVPWLVAHNLWLYAGHRCGSWVVVLSLSKRIIICFDCMLKGEMDSMRKRWLLTY